MLSPSSGVASRAAPCTRSRAASIAERKLVLSLNGRLGDAGAAGGRSGVGGGGASSSSAAGVAGTTAGAWNVRYGVSSRSSISLVSSPGVFGASSSGATAGPTRR